MTEDIAAGLLAKGSRASNEQDWESAARYFAEAAQLGNAEAQYVLGLAYQNGRGVPQSKELAIRWFMEAAENGNYDGQYSIGCAYVWGDGLPKDFVQAYRWLAPIASLRSRPEEVLLHFLNEMTAEQIEEAKRLADFYEPMPLAPDFRTMLTDDLNILLTKYGEAGAYAQLPLTTLDEAKTAAGKAIELGLQYINAGEEATVERVNAALRDGVLDPGEIRNTAAYCLKNHYVPCFKAPLLVIRLRGRTAGIQGIDVLVDAAESELDARGQQAVGSISEVI